MKVVLNEAEILLATYIGMARYNNARTHGIEDRKLSDRSCGFVDINGMGGELAACRLYNAYPDLSIVQADRLPGYDFVSSGGRRIDVKTTEYRSGKLVATMKTRVGDADVYLLVTGVLPKFEVVGFCSEERLLKEVNIGDLGKGSGYMLEQKSLTQVG